jgi:hypothetical protein
MDRTVWHFVGEPDAVIIETNEPVAWPQCPSETSAQFHFSLSRDTPAQRMLLWTELRICRQL